MAKENLKLIKFFQDRVRTKKTDLTKAELISIGIDTSVSTHEFRNIVLSKGIFGDWSLSTKNELQDLDGLPIADNKKLLQIIKAHYENNKLEIKFDELRVLNIYTPKTELIIGNFKLNGFLMSTKYNIEIIDSNKNIDGLWIDSVINKDKVMEVLHKFHITKKGLSQMKELDLNKKLEEHFKLFFAVVKKGGASNKGLIDLILGDNKFAIELKLGRELKKSDQADRARGQVDRYKEEFKNNFMFVIAGTDEDKTEKSVQDLIKKLKDTNTPYYYLNAN
jgi:hypothetical protein